MIDSQGPWQKGTLVFLGEGVCVPEEKAGQSTVEDRSVQCTSTAALLSGLHQGALFAVRGRQLCPGEALSWI